MRKKIFNIGAISIVAIIGFSLWLFSGTLIHNNQNATPSEDQTINSVANWVSNAITVSQLIDESDLVVKVRVKSEPAGRMVRNELPMVDLEGNVIGTQSDEMLFSDTSFEVLETYSGKSVEKILVMQTGGVNPDTNVVQGEMLDDPLYKVGEEYILFLVDISGDAVQAPDRELYRIVNPYGRYKIDGQNVSSYGENNKEMKLPTTLDKLLSQINENL